MTSLSQLELETREFGAHTITLGAVPVSTNQIYVPLCRKIRSWSCDKSRDFTIATPHKDIITFTSQSRDFFVSADWSGAVCLYDKIWNLKHSFEAPHAPVAAVMFVTETRLVVLSRGSNNFNPGAVSIYDITQIPSAGTVSCDDTKIGTVLVQSLVDNYVQISCDDGFLYVWKWVLPCFSFIKYDADLNEINSQEFLVEKGPNVGHAISDLDIILCLSNRSLIWLDNTSFSLIDSDHLQNVASSQIWAMEFVRSKELLFQKSLSEFVIMDIRSGSVLKKFQGPSHFVCYMSLIGSYLWVSTVEGVFRLDFTRSALYTDTIPSISSVTNTTDTTQHNCVIPQMNDTIPWLTPDLTSFHFHEVSCCGVDMTRRFIVSGDMGGNVFVWDNDVVNDNDVGNDNDVISVSDHMEVVYKYKLSDSIRCIRCIDHENILVVFIGTISGSLWCWVPSSHEDQVTCDNTEPVLLAQIQDTITCIRVFDNLLCFSSTAGYIAVYHFDRSNLINLNKKGFDMFFEKLIHVPQLPTSPDDSVKFGSLNLRAEVWSVDFSPDGSLIASCSEDQTVKITNIATRDIAHSFRDHALAVTCVKWFQYNSLSLLLSSSDDNTIVIRDMNTTIKIHVLECPDVIGFCTFTYLDVLVSPGLCEDLDKGAEHKIVNEEKGNVFGSVDEGALKVVCCTENGYMIIRDVVKGTVLYKNRVHQGSIEGLSCRNGKIVTCSSDCTVQLHTIL